VIGKNAMRCTRRVWDQSAQFRLSEVDPRFEAGLEHLSWERVDGGWERSFEHPAPGPADPVPWAAAGELLADGLIEPVSLGEWEISSWWGRAFLHRDQVAAAPP
jgi:hypothetical protein